MKELLNLKSENGIFFKLNYNNVIIIYHKLYYLFNDNILYL